MGFASPWRGRERTRAQNARAQKQGAEGRKRPPRPFSVAPELQRTRDFGDFEDFELVAFDDVVEVLDRHTALEALTHFLDVVLEALERIELARVNHDVVAQHAHRRRALDEAIRDHTAGHCTDLRYLEDLTHFDHTGHDFALLRR